MFICHNCGASVEAKSKQCFRCRTAVSMHTAVGLLEPELPAPLKVQLELQPRTLDSLIAADLIKAAGTSSLERSVLPINVSNDENNGEIKSEINDENNKNSNIEIRNSSKKELYNAPNFFERLPEMSRKNISGEEDVQEKLALQTNNEITLVTSKEPARQASSPFASMLADYKIENAAKIDQADKRAQIAKAPNWSLAEASSKAGDKSESAIGSDEAVKSFTEIVKNAEADSELNKHIEVNDNSSTETGNKSDSSLQSENNPSVSINRRSFSTVDSSGSADTKKGFSFKSSWPVLVAIGLVAFFLLFKGVEALYIAGSSLMANSDNLPAIGGQTNSFSGRWQFAARSSSDTCQGQMVVHQRGNDIFGEGVDNNLAHYKFKGSREGDHINLTKQYFSSMGFIGHPIQMHGDVDADSKPLFMHGDFSIDYMQGGKWRGKPVVIKGIWEAQMAQPLIEDDSSPINLPVLGKAEQSSESAFMNFGAYLSKNGLFIVIILAVVGWSAWHFMSSLIGPDGWLGIWDKQKYVPPQFMKEHRIVKKQFSKPLVTGSLPLGKRWEWHPWLKPFFWIPEELNIPPEIRVNNPHVLILGGGEKGKSRLMANMIAHDIDSSDRAVVVVDSDGDLADFLLRWIAAHPNGQRLQERVIIIDPTSNTPSPSFNPLELPESDDMQNASSAIVHGFKAIYHEQPGSQNQWSPQTAHILRNAAMLLMANGKTLIDLPTLLHENEFRDELIMNIEQRKNQRVEFATLLETWGQYRRLARTEQWINWYEPILNRVGPTLTNLRLRPILTQVKGELNLKDVITGKKVLIVKIPKGQLHDDANLLGSLIVAGLKQAAISLCTEGKTTDRTATMFLDEFDNFIEKETLDAITTETKKFQLGFVGSTKTLQHMPEDFRNQIVINMGTMCVFALSKKDGDMIGPQMFRVSGRKAKHRTLMNILNKVNTSPQFELISDEEKYNIDRILGQSEREFYAYRVGTVAGIFRMKSHDFDDIPDNKVNFELIEKMYKNR